jgi:hypothetical protein
MPDSPFLLSEAEQEEENRAQREAFAEAQQAALEGRPPKPAGRPVGAFGRPAFSRGAAMPTDLMGGHGQSGAYHAAIGSAMQGRALGNMISQTMAAHQDENDSRVSQEREHRRMMHEQEIERMRQETERMKIEALLARLNQASSGRITFPGGSITNV